MVQHPATPAARREAVVVAGHRGDEATARAGLADEDFAVRAAALGALARIRTLTEGDLLAAFDDPHPAVRRRAAELSAFGSTPGLVVALRRAVGDPDPLVVESACWGLGEHWDGESVDSLAGVARTHPDARCREAAVASLGAIGDPDGLAAVLGCLSDRPSVRRRAVVALAGFTGPEVEAALASALQDADWQVRQAAEILLG